MPQYLFGLLLLMALCGCGETVYAVGPANWTNLPSTPPPGATDVPGGSNAPKVVIASKTIHLYQGDPSIGWDSSAQYQAEWRAACGPTAMTVVLRAWGVSTGVETTLDRLRAANAYNDCITNLENYASIIPVYYAGLDSTYYYHLTNEHLEAMLDAGYAVLVDIAGRVVSGGIDYDFTVGHWLTIIGHDTTRGIEVRDSSGLNMHWMAWNVWDALFTHRSVLIHQKGVVLP